MKTIGTRDILLALCPLMPSGIYLANANRLHSSIGIAEFFWHLNKSKLIFWHFGVWIGLLVSIIIALTLAKDRYRLLFILGFTTAISLGIIFYSNSLINEVLKETAQQWRL